MTGGAGFIGSAFVRNILRNELKSSVEKLTILDSLTYAGNLQNLENTLSDKRVSFVHGDIRDRSLVDRLVSSHDQIVHFAAESHVDRSLHSPSTFIETNIVGTASLLDALIIHAGKRMIYVSTDEVYGSVAEGRSTEKDPLNPSSPYSSSKASGDLLCIAYASSFGIDVLVTRCCNNYGPYQFPEKIIPLFVTNLLDDCALPIYGTGVNIREWIHVDDHCRALSLLLVKGKAGQIYNIGSNFTISNLALSQKLLMMLSKDDQYIEYVADRSGHDFRYALDSTKIIDEIGFVCDIDFAAGLDRTIAWYRHNEEWWRPLKAGSTRVR